MRQVTADGAAIADLRMSDMGKCIGEQRAGFEETTVAFEVAVARQRDVPASEFFMGLLTTDIGSDEMLVEIEYPALLPRTGACFQEVARRRGDFALAGVAAMVTLDEARRCPEIRLALCGVGETPVDASESAARLIGTDGDDEAIGAVADEVRDIIDPSGNVHATPDYQRHIAGVLARRTLSTSFQRAGHGV